MIHTTFVTWLCSSLNQFVPELVRPLACFFFQIIYSLHWLPCLLVGLGLSFTYIAALSTNLLNFDSRYAGKISGILVAFFWTGNFVYNEIYFSFFVNGDPTNFVIHNVEGFMILFAVCVGVVDIAGLIFLKNVEIKGNEFEPLKDENAQELSELNKSGKDVVSYETYTDKLDSESPEKHEMDEESNDMTNTASTEINSLVQHLRNPMSLREAFFCLDLQLMIWIIAFTKCVSMVFGLNMTVMTRSLGLDYFDDRLTVIIPIERGIIALFMGFFSDFFIQKISRMAMIIFSTILGLLSQTVMLLFANILWVLVLSSVTLALSMSIASPIMPTIVRETFYVGNFGRNWGLAVMLGRILGCVLLQISGILYDNQIKGTGETLCFGMRCIRASMSISLALMALTIVFSIIIYRRLNWGRR